jgi:hypothetical protein
MLDPRRQGHAGFASVAEAEFSAHFPKDLRVLSGPWRPASDPPQATIWSLAECVPEQSFNRFTACAASEPMFRSSGWPFHHVSRLRAAMISGPSTRSILPFSPRLRAASASGSTVLRPSFETYAALARRLGLATVRCWHPSSLSSWFPEGTCPVKSGKFLILLRFPAA